PRPLRNARLESDMKVLQFLTAHSSVCFLRVSVFQRTQSARCPTNTETLRHRESTELSETREVPRLHFRRQESPNPLRDSPASRDRNRGGSSLSQREAAGASTQ